MEDFIAGLVSQLDSGAIEAVVNHICCTISNWNENLVVATLKARGLEATGRPGSLHVYKSVRL